MNSALPFENLKIPIWHALVKELEISLPQVADNLGKV
jgi:hypothetical protein